VSKPQSEIDSNWSDPAILVAGGVIILGLLFGIVMFLAAG
jgi:hypothetical protein